MKKGDVSFSMVVFAILMLIVIALVAYFLWSQFIKGADIYNLLQNKSTLNISSLGIK